MCVFVHCVSKKVPTFEKKSIYIALFYQASQSAQTWITQFYLEIIPCLPFVRKRSPDGATPTEVADI